MTYSWRKKIAYSMAHRKSSKPIQKIKTVELIFFKFSQNLANFQETGHQK